MRSAHRHRRDTPPLKRPVVFATLASAIVVASYLPYGVFAEWSYLRFLLPVFPLLFVLIGALLVTALLQVPAPIRAMAFLCALAVVASANVLRAQQEQAFNLHRYRIALSPCRAATWRRRFHPTPSSLPCRKAAAFAYYARVPIVRWDLLDVDLDTAIAALRAIGRHPVLLIEDWEVPEIAKKYPRSANARLDWAARAEFGDETRVFLYDPVDRGSDRRWRADRVH